jgi:hypothetical protein
VVQWRSLRSDSSRRGTVSARWPSPILTAATVLLVLLSITPSVGGASSNFFRNAIYTGSNYIAHVGCASVKSPTPSWSKSTGLGKLSVSAHAATCQKSKGGTMFTSQAGAIPELTVISPVHVPSGNGGVNVSWAINFAATLNYSTPSSPRCPTITSIDDTYYSAWYNSTSGLSTTTWYNVTELQTECVVESQIEFSGTASVENLSGGPTIYASNSWYGYEMVGMQIYGLSYWENFSNPAAGSNSNYSTGPPATTVFGKNPTTLTGSYDPKFFINSSAYSTAFWSSSKYEAVTDLEANVFVDVYKFAHSTANVLFNAPTIAKIVRLQPFQVW